MKGCSEKKSNTKVSAKKDVKPVQSTQPKTATKQVKKTKKAK